VPSTPKPAASAPRASRPSFSFGETVKLSGWTGAMILLVACCAIATLYPRVLAILGEAIALAQKHAPGS